MYIHIIYREYIIYVLYTDNILYMYYTYIMLMDPSKGSGPYLGIRFFDPWVGLTRLSDHPLSFVGSRGV